MAITAKEVNELRKKTGAGMMDCKKALVEADGDMNEAVDLLRKQGQKIAAKRGDREATEGLVIAKSTGAKGVLVCVNCETDFVAKNEDFSVFANTIVDIVIANGPSTVDELKSLSYSGNGMTVGEKITEQSGVIGEKIDISAEKMKDNEYELYYGIKSLIWYRDYFKEYGENLTNLDVSKILKQLNSKHIVVGHSSNEEIVGLYNNKIFGVDSSIKLGKYGELLFVINNRFYRGKLDGQLIDISK